MPAMNAALLEAINRDLPAGIDWKAGARGYVQMANNLQDAESIALYALTKPMALINPGPDGLRGLDQAVQYLLNFANILKLLRLQGGSRVMDVACGAGWVSHYFARYGYRTFGFDIAADFIKLAKRRMLEDPHLGITPDLLRTMFAVLDIETQGPGEEHFGAYDAIVLESCLHHFYDPIAALGNLAPCLNDTGLIVLLEGENRSGAIKKEYLDVMLEHHTIERPYERRQLIEIMRAAGLPHFEFLGQINGFFSPKDPVFGNATERLAETERHMNVCVCATNRAAIRRILPDMAGGDPPPSPAQAAIDHLLSREKELVALTHNQALLIGDLRALLAAGIKPSIFQQAVGFITRMLGNRS
jgi:SAM-dependent methyltransferase